MSLPRLPALVNAGRSIADPSSRDAKLRGIAHPFERDEHLSKKENTTDVT